MANFTVMHTARGTFTGRDSNFYGQFNAEGFILKITGRFSQTLPPFNVPMATMTYRTLIDLRGTYTIEFDKPPSFVGEQTVDITLKRQSDTVLHLTGQLASPTDQRQTVTGVGQWIQH